MAKMHIYQYGSESGTMNCLFFHGFPGSGLEAQLCDGWARKKSWKVFSFDRPGYGSTNSSLTEVGGAFYQELQDLLPPGKHILIGVSGGAPYAIDYAVKYPERCEALYLICPLAGLKSSRVFQSFPLWIRFLLGFFVRLPGFLQVGIFRAVNFLRGAPERYLPKFIQGLPAVDRAIFKGREPIFHAILRKAREQQMQGCVKDLHFYLSLDPGELPTPNIPVEVYHGLADTIVPPMSSIFLGEIWPHAKVELLPGEGHFSLPVVKMPKILD